MNVTMNEAIGIYARASRRWFGIRARERTQERIERLAIIGDYEGAKTHEQVNERISRLEEQDVTDSRTAFSAMS